MGPIPRVWIWRLITVMVFVSLSTAAETEQKFKVDPKVVAKLAQILEQSGYAYTKDQDNFWLVHFKGKSLSEINVVVTSAEDLVVMVSVVAMKKSIRITPEMTLKLLKLNDDIDRVKIGLDNDGNLFVRAEVAARLFDMEEFKYDVEQVAAATDKVHAEIKNYLLK